MAASAPGLTTPRAVRFAFPSRRATRCYLAALAVFFVLIGLAGVRQYREQAALREIERQGGFLFVYHDGPFWLRKWLGYDCLRTFADVSQIQVRGAQVTDGFISQLKVMTNVGCLHLEGPRVTDDRLAQLAGLTKIRTLGLAFADISDAGLVHLQGMTGLKRLGLEYTEITDAGLVHLKSLASLDTLDLHGTKVTEAGIAGLQKALPRAAISTQRK